MPRTSYATTIVHWVNLDTGVLGNQPDLEQLEQLRMQLEAERLNLVGATNRQSRLNSESQAATRDIELALARGNDFATRLRDAIRAHYGRTAENLTEFGLQPRRPRKPVPPKPVETVPTPAQQASSETDGTTQK
jgi:hypothetical protein